MTPEASASERSSDATPFRLLLQVNGLSMLRKALAIRQRSRLWAGVIGVFLVGYAVMAYLLFFQGLSFLSDSRGSADCWWNACSSCSSPACSGCSC